MDGSRRVDAENGVTAADLVFAVVLWVMKFRYLAAVASIVADHPDMSPV
jgi:hypothetical protein